MRVRILGPFHLEDGGRHSAAFSLSRQSGDRYLQAQALIGLGEISQRLGQHAQSAEYHQPALALCQAIDAWGGQTEALNGSGEALLATGQRDQSCECHTAALTLTRQTGDRYQQARAHRGLAAACQAAGQLEQARRHWEHALETYTDLGVPEASLMRSELTTAGQAATRPE